MIDQNKFSEDAENLSKTQRKKQVHDLQNLAREIVEMPASKRDKLELTDKIIQAVADSRRITSHIARKRHFQYMGKLLLKSDYIAIIESINQQEQKQAMYHVRDKVINHWLEQLTDAENDQNQLMQQLHQIYSHEHIHSLRQLLRSFAKKPNDAPMRKKVFKALRGLDEETHLPS